jgi:hypothetical protein
MNQIDNLKAMLEGLSHQVKTVTAMKNVAQKSIKDKEYSDLIALKSKELTDALNASKLGDTKKLNKFIKENASIS